MSATGAAMQGAAVLAVALAAAVAGWHLWLSGGAAIAQTRVFGDGRTWAMLCAAPALLWIGGAALRRKARKG